MPRSPHPEPLLLVSPPMLPHPPGHSSLMGAMPVKVSEGNASALGLKVVPFACGHGEETVQAPTNQLLRTVVKTPTWPSQAATPPHCPVLPTEPWRVFWAGLGGVGRLDGLLQPQASYSGCTSRSSTGREQPVLPQGQTQPRCNSFEENYSASHLLKHNCSRGGLSAVEIPNSSEAQPCPKPMKRAARRYLTFNLPARSPSGRSNEMLHCEETRK